MSIFSVRSIKIVVSMFGVYNMRARTIVTISDSVTSIHQAAFYHCDSLTAVTIPQRVTSIGDFVFYYYVSLTSITFLGYTAPSTGTNWVANTYAGLLGHALDGSDFPAPGGVFDGVLTMGEI